MTIAMIKNPATFSPVGISVPKTMFFKVFISSFSICYKKFINGVKDFFHFKTLLPK